MTLFVDKQKITGKETEQLFSAGISLLLSKAYPAAYSCFNRISDEDFSVLYNKALCCFMVKWYDECYRLLCESEQLICPEEILPVKQSYPKHFSVMTMPKGILFIPCRKVFRKPWHTGSCCC